MNTVEQLPPTKVWKLHRESPSRVIAELHQLGQRRNHGIREIILDRIQLRTDVLKALAQLFESDRHEWELVSFIDCLWPKEQDPHFLQCRRMPKVSIQISPRTYFRPTTAFIPMDTTSFFCGQIENISLCLKDSCSLEFAGRLKSFLSTSIGLRQLSLRGSWGIGSQSNILSKGFASNVSLSTLDLSDCKLDDIQTAELVRSLRGHPYLQSINLSNNQWGETTARAIGSTFLSKYTVVQSIDLSKQRKPIKTSILASFLDSDECQLRKLDLSYCGISDGEFESLLDSLSSNTSLETLDLSHNRGISEKQVALLGRKLPSLSLKSLSLRKIQGRLSDITIDEIIEGLKDNRTMTKLDLDAYGGVKKLRHIHHLLNVNYGAKQALLSPPPAAVWPLALERISSVHYNGATPSLKTMMSTDALFYTIRQSPDLWHRS